jgi:hypothetical protein
MEITLMMTGLRAVWQGGRGLASCWLVATTTPVREKTGDRDISI